MPKDEVFNELNESELIDCFCKIFYNELDSWFSADIACCDTCYDDFIIKWPAVYSRNLEFQKSSIDVKCFYNGSSLQDLFTEEECFQFIENVHCPRCGNPIRSNFWPYNFHFDLIDNFEQELEEIDNISKRAPFLLLSHPLAKKALDTINNLTQRIKSTTIDKKYYRARKFEKDKIYVTEDFKYPPRDKLREGRYNHSGFPVIYLSDSPTTCYYELRRPDEGIAVAELNITKPIKILDLIEIEDDWNNIINIAVWSSLMSSPVEGEGWYKPQYTFTRFIADCAISAGFDAIKYPSVRLGERYNIVILDGINDWVSLDITQITEMHFEAKDRLL